MDIDVVCIVVSKCPMFIGIFSCGCVVSDSIEILSLWIQRWKMVILVCLGRFLFQQWHAKKMTEATLVLQKMNVSLFEANVCCSFVQMCLFYFVESLPCSLESSHFKQLRMCFLLSCSIFWYAWVSGSRICVPMRPTSTFCFWAKLCKATFLLSQRNEM